MARSLDGDHDQRRRRDQHLVRQFDLHDARAELAEGRDRVVERLVDIAFEVVDIEALRNADGHAARRALRGLCIPCGRAVGGRIERVGSGCRRRDQPAVFRGARERPDGIERERERHRIGAADAAVGRLQSRDAAEMRGQADRAAGVGAERGGHEPCADRCARAGGGAAGDMRRMPRITDMAGVDVVAGRSERKLHHVERAEPESAGGFELQRVRLRSQARSSPCGSSSRIRRACP